MERYVGTAYSAGFGALHPFTRAAFAHHALTHVAPFADGNGRVARVLACAHVSRAVGVPFLVFADESGDYDRATATADAGDPAVLVDFVARRAWATVDLVDDARATARTSPDQVAALDQWRGRADAGTALCELLPAAVDRALSRHRRRTDLAGRSALTDAAIGPDLVIRDGPSGVEEALVVDAHPLLDDHGLVLRAGEAQLRLDLDPEELSPAACSALRSRLDPWLDRVTSVLALRVAAELE
jgi:hypothetical protein